MDNYTVIIKSSNKGIFFDLPALYRYRELFYVLAWRDIKVRYKQTLLGVAWALMQPLVSMVIFTIFFGRLAKIPSGELPYSLFVLCGLVFWTFFSGSLTHASSSMIDNENIIKKVYFPKMILPLSSIVTSSIDFAINFLLLLIFALFLGFIPSLWILLILPLTIFLTAITAGGLGLFLASFNVKYRDVRYVLPFFIQIMIFVTPVIYPLSMVSQFNQYLLALNPMTSVIELMRVVFTGGSFISLPVFILSTISALTIFIVGIVYFKKTERFFADIV